MTIAIVSKIGTERVYIFRNTYYLHFHLWNLKFQLFWNFIWPSLQRLVLRTDGRIYLKFLDLLPSKMYSAHIIHEIYFFLFFAIKNSLHINTIYVFPKLSSIKNRSRVIQEIYFCIIYYQKQSEHYTQDIFFNFSLSKTEGAFYTRYIFFSFFTIKNRVHYTRDIFFLHFSLPKT